MTGNPSILFVALVHRDYSPLRSAYSGMGNTYELLPHKYAVLSLVAWLRENGCDGRYVWIESNDREAIAQVEKAIDRYKPDAIGMSLTTEEVIPHCKIAGVLKEKYPNLPIIVGGPHPSALPEHTLENFPAVDYVAIGEGERTLTEWLFAISLGGRKSRMRDIPGLAFRDDDGGIVVTPPREKFENINVLPNPAYDLILDPSEPSVSRPCVPIVFSYGCPFFCTFCSADHGNYRFVKPVNAVNRIEWAQKKFGVTDFAFCDSFWPPSGKWLDEFCKEIEKRRISIRFHFETRTGVLSHKQFERLRDIGAQAIAVGVESGDPFVLRRIRKGITVDQARKTFDALNSVGIFARALFMFGNQGETVESIQASIDLMHRLNAPVVTLSVFRPLPGSDDFGLITDREKDWWMHGDESGRWWAGGTYPSICEFSVEDLLLLAREVGLRYPLRASYVLQHIIGGSLSLKYRMVAARIFLTHLRRYLLGISERYEFFRTLIRGAKTLLRS